jgi:hypothetical protein
MLLRLGFCKRALYVDEWSAFTGCLAKSDHEFAIVRVRYVLTTAAATKQHYFKAGV